MEMMRIFNLAFRHTSFQFLIFKIIVIISILSIFGFIQSVKAITVESKEATIYCQNDSQTSLKIPADVFKKPVEITFKKVDAKDMPESQGMDFFPDMYYLEVTQKETGKTIDYFRHELELKIPIENYQKDGEENLTVFSWDRNIKTWLSNSGEVIEDQKYIIGKINYTGYFVVMPKIFSKSGIDHYKYGALVFVVVGLAIIIVIWYNEKKSAKKYNLKP